jgi:hypothetical protein
MVNATSFTLFDKFHMILSKNSKREKNHKYLSITVPIPLTNARTEQPDLNMETCLLPLVTVKYKET